MTRHLFSNFFPKDVLALVSDRSVDFRFAKNSFKFKTKQIKFLKNAGVDPTRLNFAVQVHGRRILLTGKRKATSRPPREADGFLCDEKQVPVSVRTADCLSIFIYDIKKEVTALVHAGWKGTQKEIAVAALDQLRRKWKCRPEDLKIAFGPAIRSCCYAVGPEFARYFPGHVAKRGNKVYFDLVAANRRQITSRGVPAKNIFDCSVCTVCDRNYFSNRRDGEKAGRMISVMMMKA